MRLVSVRLRRPRRMRRPRNVEDRRRKNWNASELKRRGVKRKRDGNDRRDGRADVS